MVRINEAGRFFFCNYNGNRSMKNGIKLVRRDRLPPLINVKIFTYTSLSSKFCCTYVVLNISFNLVAKNVVVDCQNFFFF